MARIVIAERDGQLAQRLRDRLQEDGHSVDIFDETARLATALAHSLPDLLVLGDRDHGRSAPEIVRTLNRDANTARIAIVVIAGDSDRDAMVEALKAGAADWVSKPLMPAELAWRVNALLDRTVPSAATPRPSTFA